ncbi:MAG: chemotaxis protein CheC [bacterium]|jgi:chemotaxis protein CheC
MLNNEAGLSEWQSDVLREVFNIGAGNAATSLSLLLDTPVTMDVPEVKLLPFAAVADQLGGEEEIVAAVLLTIAGSAGGSFVFLLPLSSARNLISNLFGFPKEKDDSFNAMEMSALTETGNIMGASFLSALAGLTGLALSATVPDAAVDMAGAVLSVPLIRASRDFDCALVMAAQLVARGEKIDCFFFLLPDSALLSAIFAKIKVAADGQQY